VSLPDAAEEAIKKITDYDEAVDTATARLKELKEQLEKLDEQVSDQFDDLVEDANEFLSKVAQETDALGTQCEETGNALADLQSTVRSTQAEAATAVDDGKADVAELKDRAAGLIPKVEDLAHDGAEQPGNTLAENATEILRELDEAMDEARNFLDQEVAQEITQLETMIESWSEVVLKSFQDASKHLDEVYVEWAGNLVGAGDIVENDGFEKAKEHVGDCVDYALGDCKKDHETRLNILSNVVDETAEKLTALKDALEEKQDEIEKGQKSLAGDLEELKEAVDDATKALDEVAQFLAAYRFVRMS
jgi:chromosome segregation ATPase